MPRSSMEEERSWDVSSLKKARWRENERRRFFVGHKEWRGLEKRGTLCGREREGTGVREKDMDEDEAKKVQPKALKGTRDVAPEAELLRALGGSKGSLKNKASVRKRAG